MASKCEKCGARGAVIERGVFAGQYGELDYCKFCYADLCPDCMDRGCPDNPDGGKHLPYEDEEEDEE